MLAVIMKHEKEAPFPLRHIWQRPDGHRRAAILNKGISNVNKGVAGQQAYAIVEIFPGSNLMEGAMPALYGYLI